MAMYRGRINQQRRDRHPDRGQHVDAAKNLTPVHYPPSALGFQRRRWDDGGSAIQIVCDIKEFATGPSAIRFRMPTDVESTDN